MITFYNRTMTDKTGTASTVTYFRSYTYVGWAHFTVDRPATASDKASYPTQWAAYDPASPSVDPLTGLLTAVVAPVVGLLKSL